MYLYSKAFILAFLLLPIIVYAHPGNTDSSGCHTCRTNCVSWGLSTGEYHCHRAKTYNSQPLEPVTSHKVEGGVGYTEPSPEYKEPLPKYQVPIKQNIPNSIPNDQVDKESNGNLVGAIFWVVVFGGGLIYLVKKHRK